MMIKRNNALNQKIKQQRKKYNEKFVLKIVILLKSPLVKITIRPPLIIKPKTEQLLLISKIMMEAQ